MAVRATASRCAAATLLGLSAFATAAPGLAQRGTESEVAPPGAQQEQRGRAGSTTRPLDPARSRDMSRSRDRANVPLYVQDLDTLRRGDIYGSQLMTDLEREQYRERLRLLRDDSAWARMQERHQDDMRDRAERRGAQLDPPLYGQHLMTVREQALHRERLASAASERERATLRARHITAMQERARRIGVRLTEPFYGQQLMSDSERERLAARLRAAPTEREREVIRAEHQRAMQTRARNAEVSIAELDLAVDSNSSLLR